MEMNQAGAGNVERGVRATAFSLALKVERCMLIRLLDNLPGQRGCEVIAFKIEVMLSGVPSRAKAETERSRSIP